MIDHNTVKATSNQVHNHSLLRQMAAQKQEKLSSKK